MAGQASDYHRGEMDIQEQVATFQLVMGMTKWGSLILASLLLFFVMWFCTSFGFVGGLVSGIVLATLGVVLLRDSGGH